MNFKNLAILAVFCLFSTNAMATELWNDYSVKKVESEINYSQTMIDELQGLYKYLPKSQYYGQLKVFNNNIRAALDSLDSNQRSLLIKNYEHTNPKVAVALKKIR